MALKALAVDQPIDFLLGPLVHINFGAAVELRSARFFGPLPLVCVRIVSVGVFFAILVD